MLTEVTPDFFPTLGAKPRVGRIISPGEAKASVVVNDEFWRERLHAQSSAIGSSITISGQLRTIIGVMPSGFHVPLATGVPTVYLPISVGASGQDEMLLESASRIARLKPGSSEQQALENARLVFANAEKSSAERDRRLVMRRYREFLVGDLRRPVSMLLGAVTILLLLACANAANLQIGQAASRLSETATRVVLGASFGRLVQQITVESLLVSLVSGPFGSASVFVAVGFIRHLYGTEFSRFDERSVHPTILVWTVFLAAALGVLASIAPALRVRRQAKDHANVRTVTRGVRLSGMLVAAQPRVDLRPFGCERALCANFAVAREGQSGL